jgi:hypothetical protein
MTLFVSGCATKHDKLQAYVGKDINEAVTALGHPTVAFDMQEGHRDFQWVITKSTLPSYIISTGALNDPAQQFDPAIKTRTITPMFDGKVIASDCVYTLLTHWFEDKKSWIVFGYQIPTSGC